MRHNGGAAPETVGRTEAPTSPKAMRAFPLGMKGIIDVKTVTKVGVGAAVATLAGALTVSLTPQSAEAHGAYTYPASRTYACYVDGIEGGQGGNVEPTNPACADALAEGGSYPFWNWFGNLISDADGNHEQVVADGELCGPTEDFAAFNAVREDWPTTSLTAGATVEFQHNAWAHHPGTFYTYVTDDSWDPSQPLNWSDLELFHEITDPPQRADGVEGAEYYWDVTLPDRSGQHIIYVVWERSDSPEAFYNCSDVVFE